MGIGEFTRFALVGALATVFQYLFLFVAVQWFQMNAVLASSLGFTASAVINYLLNYKFTFRAGCSHAPAVLKFMLLAGVGLLLNGTIMHLLITNTWHYLVAQIAATLLVLVWNYLGNSLWTFQES